MNTLQDKVKYQPEQFAYRYHEEELRKEEIHSKKNKYNQSRSKISGFDKGRIILQEIPKGPQPSIFAASLISNKLGISVKEAHVHFESSAPHRVNN
jgi:hypothetical protein